MNKSKTFFTNRIDKIEVPLENNIISCYLECEWTKRHRSVDHFGQPKIG